MRISLNLNAACAPEKSEFPAEYLKEPTREEKGKLDEVYLILEEQIKPLSMIVIKHIRVGFYQNTPDTDPYPFFEIILQDPGDESKEIKVPEVRIGYAPPFFSTIRPEKCALLLMEEIQEMVDAKLNDLEDTFEELQGDSEELNDMAEAIRRYLDDLQTATNQQPMSL